MDYIKAIAEVRSISVAAENLGISQPALSAHLKKKEKEIGTEIFDRSKKPIQLTEAGKAYLEYIQKCNALENEFQQKVADLEGLKSGKLTIGGASFFNSAYLPNAIKVFQEKYPGIQLEIVDDKVPELVNAAWRGGIDIFITPIKEDEERFHFEELAEETIYLAVPSNWDINKKLRAKAVKEGKASEPLNEREFRELCEYPFILLSKSQDIGKKAEELFQQFRCRPEKVIKAEQTMTTLALSVSGVGISLISQRSILNSRLPEDPMLYLADEEICKRKIYIAYPKNKYLSKAASIFIDLLKEIG